MTMIIKEFKKEWQRVRVEQLSQPIQCIECGKTFIRNKLTEHCCGTECKRKRNNRNSYTRRALSKSYQ